MQEVAGSIPAGSTNGIMLMPRCRAPVLCVLVLTGCATTGDVMRAGNDTYEISIPTANIPVAKGCEACEPPQAIQVPDIAGAGTRAMERAHKYCAKMRKAMAVTGGGFDMGSGLRLIFRCVPSQPGAVDR
jgi:hypothetical protein